MTVSKFAAQSDPDSPLLFIRFVQDRDVFSLWDQVSQVSYFEFRKRIAEIARLNLEQVHGARIWNGLNDFAAWMSQDEDAWLVPVDDDDLFSPELVPALTSLPKSVNVVHWPEHAYTFGGSHAHGPYHTGSQNPQIQPTPNKVLWTNNWAVRKSFLKAHFRDSDIRRILTDHWFASVELGRLFDCHPPKPPQPWYEFEISGPGTRLLPIALSLTVYHPASLFFLWNVLQTDQPAAEFAGRSFGARASIGRELSWSIPWVRDYEDLLAEAFPMTANTTGSDGPLPTDR